MMIDSIIVTFINSSISLNVRIGKCCPDTSPRRRASAGASVARLADNIIIINVKSLLSARVRARKRTQTPKMRQPASQLTRLYLGRRFLRLLLGCSRRGSRRRRRRIFPWLSRYYMRTWHDDDRTLTRAHRRSGSGWRATNGPHTML